jgi:hypothetical protein
MATKQKHAGFDYDQIDILVNYCDLTDSWHTTLLAYDDLSDASETPNDGAYPGYESDSEEAAVEAAIARARHVVSNGEAAGATVLLDGNEEFHVKN